jgi:hypothetical protein
MDSISVIFITCSVLGWKYGGLFAVDRQPFGAQAQ